jgi:hypothetical protein
MPDNTAANVEVAVTGNVYMAPTTANVPSTVFSTLDATWINVGYIGDDGVTENPSRDTTDITAWGGDVVRTVQTKFALEISFEMVETNTTSLALYYGADYATGVTGEPLPHKSMIIDWQDGIKMRRNYYADVQIKETGERKLNSNGVASFPVTIACYPDTSGKYCYLLTDDDSVS